MTHFRIKPDSRLENDKLEQFAQTLCLYRSPAQRWNKERKCIHRQHFVSLDTVLLKGGTTYTVTVPQETSSIARKAIETTWPRATVEEVQDPFDRDPIATGTLSLKHHYMFALRVDRRTIGLVASLLETTNMMEDGEAVYIQTLAEPAPQDWHVGASEAYKRFKQGHMPIKWSFNSKNAMRLVTKAAAGAVSGAIGVITELITDEEPERLRLDDGERAEILRDGSLRRETIGKTRGDAYDVVIRVGVVAGSQSRATALLRMATLAFRELDGDNALVAAETNTLRTWRRMKDRSVGFRPSKDYMSIPEVSRLFLMPTGPLQEKYRIDNIKTLETEIPGSIRDGGIRIGSHDYKSVTQPVFQPIDNQDELCLPHVVIGGMGSGKTRGFGANWIVESVRNGFGALAIDPAKGEIGDEVAAALPVEKVIRIRLGEIPIALDWCEVQHSKRTKNRLANTVLGFFNGIDDAGFQKSRYIRAAVMAMQTGRLSEIIRIFEDNEYREKVIDTMPDGVHKATLTTFGEESDARQRQIMSPVYNRFDVILGDEYLSECMESDLSLDMVKLMSQRKAVIIDVPKSELGPEAVDLIVNLLVAQKRGNQLQLNPENGEWDTYGCFTPLSKSRVTWPRSLKRPARIITYTSRLRRHSRIYVRK